MYIFFNKNVFNVQRIEKKCCWHYLKFLLLSDDDLLKKGTFIFIVVYLFIYFFWFALVRLRFKFKGAERNDEK